MPFSLHERALYALMALDDIAAARLIAAIEAIESRPADYIHAAGHDVTGRACNICYCGDFRIHFDIDRNGSAFIRDILAR